jgi:transposase
VLTSLPGVSTTRAAAFACHALPIERFASAEQLYSASGLAPASHQSATISRRGSISRQGLAECRDALMAIAWGLSQFSESFRARDQELRARGFRPIQARVALARCACRLCFRLLQTQQPSTKSVIVGPGTVAGGDGVSGYAARRRKLACRPPALAALYGANESLPHDGA